MSTDIEETYRKLMRMLAKKHPSVSYYSDDDPMAVLVRHIAMMSAISEGYTEKYIDNKYLKYPLNEDKAELRVLETFGFLPKPVIPATVTFTLRYSAGLLPDSIIIPAGTRFSIQGDSFVTFEDFFFPPFNSFTEVTAIKGELLESSFSITDINNCQIMFPQSPVALDYVKLSSNRVPFEKTRDCRYKTGAGIFGAEYSHDGNYYIVFPYDYAESLKGYTSFSLSYISADSGITYDPTQEILSISDSIYTDSGVDVTDDISVYSINSFSYGDFRHSIKYCYQKLGKIMPTFGRAITLEDYKVLTDNYPGVAVSAAYDLSSPRRYDPFIYIQVPYYVKIVVAPVENYYPTEYLIQELYDYYRKIGISDKLVTIQIIQPRYRLIDLSIAIHAEYMTNEELLDSYLSVYNSISDFFKVGNLEFGCEITSDMLISVILKADRRILYADCIEFADGVDVLCEADELPILGNMNISYNYEKIIVSEEIPVNIKETLEREELEIISIEEEGTVSPYAREYIFFSDEIYRDTEDDIDITIKRITNVAFANHASADLNRTSETELVTDCYIESEEEISAEDSCSEIARIIKETAIAGFDSDYMAGDENNPSRYKEVTDMAILED